MPPDFVENTSAKAGEQGVFVKRRLSSPQYLAHTTPLSSAIKLCCKDWRRSERLSCGSHLPCSTSAQVASTVVHSAGCAAARSMPSEQDTLSPEAVSHLLSHQKVLSKCRAFVSVLVFISGAPGERGLPGLSAVFAVPSIPCAVSRCLRYSSRTVQFTCAVTCTIQSILKIVQ